MHRVEGQRVSLRLVAPEDAAYIHRLRMDPRYNAHLSAVTGTVQDQRRWIERYKERESQSREFYYIIERRADRLGCGVVRLYDISGDQFSWGSWILDQNKPSLAALESAVLSFGAAFERLGLARAEIDVRKENARAIGFYRRFGMREVSEDSMNYYFDYSRECFLSALPKYLAAIAAA